MKMTTIRISSQASDKGMTLVVEDDGLGISREDENHLFERGYGKHSGFGLFLSREILSITGIAITETGTPGTGARFEITVPHDGYRLTGSKS
jgi:signal transduction histidine kinase